MLALKKKQKKKTRPLITQCNRNQKQFSPILMDWYVLQKLKYSYFANFYNWKIYYYTGDPRCGTLNTHYCYYQQ